MTIRHLIEGLEISFYKFVTSNINILDKKTFFTTKESTFRAVVNVLLDQLKFCDLYLMMAIIFYNTIKYVRK